MSHATAPIGALDTAALPRHLPWDGTFNVRDVGGYRADGGTVRWRRLLRADSLAHLTDEGRAAMASAGVRAVIDLRTTSERQHLPDALPETDLQVHPSPLFEFAADVAGVPTGTTSLESIYRHVIDTAGPRISRAVEPLTDHGTLPAVVHCTAGKDRTGLVIALVLSAIGVPDDEIATDFAASRGHLSGGFLERVRARHDQHGVPFEDDAVEMYVGSDAELIHAALDRVRRGYGDAAGYLEHHGLSAEQLHRLHATLVEPAPPAG